MDRNYFISAVQAVLNKRFDDTERRTIKTHEERLNFRCPYCDEGNTLSKKRCNLYLDTLLVICFRCGKKTGFQKFVQDYSVDISPEDRLALMEFSDSRAKSLKIENVNSLGKTLDKAHAMSDIIKAFAQGGSVYSAHGYYDLKEIQPGGLVDIYLNVERKISPDKRTNIWECKRRLKNGKSEPMLVFLNRRGEDVLSFQIRNMATGTNRIYKIFDYTMLSELLDKDIDEETMRIYHKLSFFFGVLNVDFEKKVTIFEGYLDSLFYPNSIGCVGAQTDYRLLENSGANIQYFFDNDDTGHRKSLEKIKKGHRVFLWDKMIKYSSTNCPDPYRVEYSLKKCKDLNQLAIIFPNPYRSLDLQSYFSKDELDLAWIPYVPYTPTNKKKYSDAPATASTIDAFLKYWKNI